MFLQGINCKAQNSAAWVSVLICNTHMADWRSARKLHLQDTSLAQFCNMGNCMWSCVSVSSAQDVSHGARSVSLQLCFPLMVEVFTFSTLHHFQAAPAPVTAAAAEAPRNLLVGESAWKSSMSGKFIVPSHSRCVSPPKWSGNVDIKKKLPKTDECTTLDMPCKLVCLT